MKLGPNEACPCASGKKYKRCYRAYHGGAPAPTPEALMRSRYAAAKGRPVSRAALERGRDPCFIASDLADPCSPGAEYRPE